MKSLTRCMPTAFLLAAPFLGLMTGCRDNAPPPDKPVSLRIGYRSSLPADVGALWAYETGALSELGLSSTVQGYGPPYVLLEALRSNSIDLVTVMPLEPVLEDIRLGKANYLIYCLLCFSPSEEFDAIVVKTTEDDPAPSWQTVTPRVLGVIPAKQNALIGSTIVENAGAGFEIRQYNPQNPLLSLESGDFGAVHVLGTDVARAKASNGKFIVMEACPASRRVFGGKITPAGVGLISKKWLDLHPNLAHAVVNTVLRFSKQTRSTPGDKQLVGMLEKEKYGGLSPEVSRYLAYAPLIPYSEVKPTDFAPLLLFLQKKNVETASVESILRHVYSEN